MEKRGKTVLILGATGLTGGKLLELLLRDDDVAEIKLFSRGSVGIEDPKIEEYIGDILHLETFKKNFFGDVLYCCVGTTKSKTPKKAFYRKIDFGIPVAAAKLAKENDIPKFIVISTLGANPKSTLFYNRLKGKMEAAVLEIGVQQTYILQPSLISGRREERRPGEWLFKQLMKVARVVLAGPLEKYRAISPQTIALAMHWLATHEYEKTRIESDEIKKIAIKK